MPRSLQNSTARRLRSCLYTFNNIRLQFYFTACLDLRKTHAFMQQTGSFLSGCVLRMHKKVNEATSFYVVRVNERLINKSLLGYLLSVNAQRRLTRSISNCEQNSEHYNTLQLSLRIPDVSMDVEDDQVEGVLLQLDEGQVGHQSPAQEEEGVD